MVILKILSLENGINNKITENIKIKNKQITIGWNATELSTKLAVKIWLVTEGMIAQEG